MKKMFKRFGAMFLVVAMLVAMIPMIVLADSKDFYLGSTNSRGTKLSEGTNIIVTHPSTGTKTYKLAYYDGDNDYDAFTLKFGDQTYNVENDKKLDLIDKTSLNDGDYITVSDIDGDKITIEKRTGFYVKKNNETEYKAFDIATGTVTKNDKIMYYGTKGKLYKIDWYVGEYKESDKKKNNETSYEVEGTDTYTLSFIAKEGSGQEDGNVLLTKVQNYATITVDPTYVEGDLTYTGLAQNIIVPGEVENGTLYYAIADIKPGKDSEVWEKAGDESLKKTDAGTYTGWYKVEGNEGYTGIEPTKIKNTTKAIAPMQVDVPKAINPTYNGQPQAGVEFAAPIVSFFGDNVMQTNVKSFGKYKTAFALGNDWKTGKVNYVWKGKTGWEAITPIVVEWNIVKRDVQEGDLVLTLPDTTEGNLKYTGKNTNVKVDLKESLKDAGFAKYFVLDEDNKAVYGVYLPGTYNVYGYVTGGKNFNKTQIGKAVYVGSFTIDPVEIIAGDKGVFTKGTDGTLEITADGPYHKETYSKKGREFNGLKVRKVGEEEWEKVTKDVDYTVVEGSTKVTLANEYLSKLDAGEYELLFVYDKGNVTATATFTVKGEAPKTGDESNLLIWIVMGSLAFLTMLGAAYLVLRKDF